MLFFKTVFCVGFSVNKQTMLSEKRSSIHSGHFMVSCIYEADDSDALTNVKAEPDRQGYNFEAADRQLRKTYMFGNRSTNAPV